MPPLSPELRGTLERAVILARDEAEKAAEVALKTLAVDKNEAFATHSEQQRRLRNALRAKGRQLGGGSLSAGFRLLVEEVAYEQWHRMLFARFLLENDLLIHPTGAAVSLQDCAELAEEEGESDPWALAARYASAMLPGIFAKDDPSVEVILPPEGRAALENIVAGLPASVFTSDDGLGWVYQFWQSKRKKEVSSSGRKIAGMDLAAYSELFTEDYMVRFLLENTLGAWWAARHPDSPLVKQFAYLRFWDDGTPAAGSFEGWPEGPAAVTVMDPSCGSGHFLVVAFEMLREMRAESEGLTQADAADAALRDNLFGLELDPRCVQLAAFSLALAAWKAGGYRPIPIPNVACSGIAVSGQLEQWTKLAADDANLKYTLEQLYQLFRSAPDLGSLIDPTNVPLRDRMFTPDYAGVGPLLQRVLAKERVASDPVAAIFGLAATGVARATELLARKYTLVATNVPYLARGKQGETLREFIERQYPEAKADLATAFLERCRAFAAEGGSYAMVTPQNWLFLNSYRRLREGLLREQTWHSVSKLGEGAFESAAAAGAFIALVILSTGWPDAAHTFVGLDISQPRTAQGKARMLRNAPLLDIEQAKQLGNIDSRILFVNQSDHALLRNYAASYLGLGTGDSAKYLRFFWELSSVDDRWAFCQSSVQETQSYGGREQIVAWNRAIGRVRGMSAAEREQIHNQDCSGKAAWSKQGVAVGLMRRLPVTLYDGAIFDKSMAVLVPKAPEYLAPIWAYCNSSDFHDRIREIDHKTIVANGTLTKIAFDLKRWQEAAQAMGALPEPYSPDPTQWLFAGNSLGSAEPLQVAVARLLGYHWPQQNSDRLSSLADDDGIVPLPPVAREEPAAERVRGVLAAAYDESWSPQLQEELLGHVRFAGKGLDVWLRDGFFEQHCRIFKQRPFVWHIWDGRRDGFSALANYHKLDAARFDKLIYTYLGEWIRTQRAARDAGTPGADGRLVAALELQKKLEAIRDGEPPYDIYVRWKSLDAQPIGWNPDLSDGVRINIRPFVTAGILRSRVNVNWNKDRGLNADGTERINERHLTVAEKQAALRVAKP